MAGIGMSMGGPNVIGNLSDSEEAASSMAGLSVREQGRVPKSLVKTRRERKNDSLMAEAGQRTQEALAARKEGP